ADVAPAPSGSGRSAQPCTGSLNAVSPANRHPDAGEDARPTGGGDRLHLCRGGLRRAALRGAHPSESRVASLARGAARPRAIHAHPSVGYRAAGSSGDAPPWQWGKLRSTTRERSSSTCRANAFGGTGTTPRAPLSPAITVRSEDVGGNPTPVYGGRGAAPIVGAAPRFSSAETVLINRSGTMLSRDRVRRFARS